MTLPAPEQALQGLRERFPALSVTLSQSFDAACAALPHEWTGGWSMADPEGHHHATVRAMVRRVPDHAQAVSVYYWEWSNGLEIIPVLGLVWSAPRT